MLTYLILNFQVATFEKIGRNRLNLIIYFN